MSVCRVEIHIIFYFTIEEQRVTLRLPARDTSHFTLKVKAFQQTIDITSSQQVSQKSQWGVQKKKIYDIRYKIIKDN